MIYRSRYLEPMFKILKFTVREFLYGLHILSLGSAAIVVVAQMILIRDRIDLAYPFVIYLVAYSSYLYNRYREIDIDEDSIPVRTKHFRKYFRLTPFILVLGFLLSLVTLIAVHKVAALWYIALLFLSGFLYTDFIKGLTKYVPLLKNFFVALEWTLPVIFLPLYYSAKFSLPLFAFAFFVFMKTLIVNIFFDIKDKEVDLKMGLKTLPTIIGTKRSIYVLSIVSLFSMLFLVAMVNSQVLPLLSLMLLFLYLFNIYCFSRAMSGIHISELYFIAGSEFIFWPVVLYFAEFVLKMP